MLAPDRLEGIDACPASARNLVTGVLIAVTYAPEFAPARARVGCVPPSQSTATHTSVLITSEGDTAMDLLPSVAVISVVMLPLSHSCDVPAASKIARRAYVFDVPLVVVMKSTFVHVNGAGTGTLTAHTACAVKICVLDDPPLSYVHAA